MKYYDTQPLREAILGANTIRDTKTLELYGLCTTNKEGELLYVRESLYNDCALVSEKENAYFTQDKTIIELVQRVLNERFVGQYKFCIMRIDITVKSSIL